MNHSTVISLSIFSREKKVHKRRFFSRKSNSTVCSSLRPVSKTLHHTDCNLPTIPPPPPPLSQLKFFLLSQSSPCNVGLRTRKPVTECGEARQAAVAGCLRNVELSTATDRQDRQWWMLLAALNAARLPTITKKSAPVNGANTKGADDESADKY